MSIALLTTSSFLRSSPSTCMYAADGRVFSTSPPTCNMNCWSHDKNKNLHLLDLEVINWLEMLEDDERSDSHEEALSDKIMNFLDSIRSMLSSTDDGDISISPYDTAWVTFVDDMVGNGNPQFPSSLEWIANNQLSDGSWGDTIFLAHDRILNTLACVVALRSRNMHPHKCNKGISFIKENLYKLEDENAVHMPIGFEVALPSLIEMAKKLGIEIPDASPGMKKIYASRDLKLKRIPRDVIHNVPTTLLFSLEGMPDLDWKKLLKLQCVDGSFLFSPSSTAFALQQTKDIKCLKYLTAIVEKFDGGVPNVYPVDMFEKMFAVDRLQRLGISRVFQQEIEGCLDYVHRHWTNKGICWARNSKMEDVDDTAMGFRLLRLYGYEVSPDAFQQFENDEEFVCFNGQSSQAVTGIYNLYRASQLKFPGEKILENANKFSRRFLQEKRANDELLDKWIIIKDLPGEVGYALDIPWYANLPRVESRFYIEQYGGQDDVWIGKTLYRMPRVNNDTYLEFAKLDYNSCQVLHQLEWKNIQKWYKGCGLILSDRSLLLGYYLAAASIFEPEKSKQRLAWAKTTILLEAIDGRQLSIDQKHAFVREFQSGRSTSGHRYNNKNGLVGTLLKTLNDLSLDLLMTQSRDIHTQLYDGWLKWLKTWENGDGMGRGDVELLVHTLNLSGINQLVSNEELLSHPKYQKLMEVTTRVCYRLRQFHLQKVHDDSKATTNLAGCITTVEIESDMQELVKLVLTKSEGDLDSDTKKNFLAIAKSFYYVAHCSTETIDFHVTKVLFERVI